MFSTSLRKPRMLLLSGVLLAAMVLAVVSVAHALTTITAGNGDVTITQVVYDDAGTLITQNVSQTTTNDGTSNDIFIHTITIDDGGTTVVLDEYNPTATITAVNFPAGLTGVQVNQNDTHIAFGDAGFATALGDAFSNLDINEFIEYDHLSSNGSNWNPDFDVMFSACYESGDYIYIQERNGNTFFDLVPLDADGLPIAGGETIGFDNPYRWNTGYAPSNRTSQEHWIIIVSYDVFNVTDPICGFRVDNDGEADVKLLGLSETPFVGSIAGQVRLDTDADGDLGDGESGIVGVTITLRDADGNVVATAITSDGTADVDGDGSIDPAGSYYFGNLPAGNYTVEESDPANHSSTNDADGGTSNEISVPLNRGADAVDNDFLDTAGQPTAITLNDAGARVSLANLAALVTALVGIVVFVIGRQIMLRRDLVE